jgi:hypothetical protein
MSVDELLKDTEADEVLSEKQNLETALDSAYEEPMTVKPKGKRGRPKGAKNKKKK